MNDDATPVVELRDLHLAFGEKEILSGVNLRVPARARLVVLGQSGSGKSTLLRLILGILRPSRGEVRFKGLEVTRMGRRRLNRVRQKIGMVYQYSALISSLSVRDNLALPLEELTRKTRQEIDQLVDEKLTLVGMADARDKMPSELSGGMRKRIGLVACYKGLTVRGGAAGVGHATTESVVVAITTVIGFDTLCNVVLVSLFDK